MVTKSNAGRPTKYKAEYVEQARKLALLGLTDVEMADVFGVTEKTFNNWKSSHPEFLQSLKSGKVFADANVTDRLYQRAMGFEHLSEKVFNYQGEIVRAKTREIYPPDTTACIFWLKNRQRDKWRDKPEGEADDGLTESIEKLIDKLPG